MKERESVILLLVSTGVRVGAIPDLRLRNLDRIDSNESNYPGEIYKIKVYEGFKDEYVTFTTP